MALRRCSARRRARLNEAVPVRAAFVLEVGRCEGCLKRWNLIVHEIARGPDRHKAQDKRYATLVLGNLCCHERIGNWPREKQLALLKLRRPEDYDLAAYNALVGRQIEQAAVDSHLASWRKESAQDQ